MADLGLTLLRKVGPLDKGISAALKVSMEFQMKRLEGEAKRLNDPTTLIRTAALQRLAHFDEEGVFTGGYVVNEHPRDFEITQAVMDATEGFAIADQAGKVIAKFDSLADAESALAGAKVEMKVSVDLPKAVKEAAPA